MLVAGVTPLILPSQIICVEEVPYLGSAKTEASALSKLAVR